MLFRDGFIDTSTISSDGVRLSASGADRILKNLGIVKLAHSKLAQNDNKPMRLTKKTAMSNKQRRTGTLTNDNTNEDYQTIDGVHPTRTATKKLCKNLMFKEHVTGVYREGISAIHLLD